MSTNDHEPRPRPRRGFAALDPERRREIARQGGRMAHELGVAHEFTSAEARIARARSLHGSTDEDGDTPGP